MNQTVSSPSDSDFLEHPDSVSPSFVLGMLVTFVITLILLVIPALAMYLFRELRIRKKAPFAS